MIERINPQRVRGIYLVTTYSGGEGSQYIIGCNKSTAWTVLVMHKTHSGLQRPTRRVVGWCTSGENAASHNLIRVEYGMCLARQGEQADTAPLHTTRVKAIEAITGEITGDKLVITDPGQYGLAQCRVPDCLSIQPQNCRH